MSSPSSSSTAPPPLLARELLVLSVEPSNVCERSRSLESFVMSGSFPIADKLGDLYAEGKFIDVLRECYTTFRGSNSSEKRNENVSKDDANLAQLLFGISCLQVYTQNIVTGKGLNDKKRDLEILEKRNAANAVNAIVNAEEKDEGTEESTWGEFVNWFKRRTLRSKKVVSDLEVSIDGEFLDSLISTNRFFLIAAYDTFASLASSLPTASIWLGRAAFLYQRALADANENGAGHAPRLLSQSFYDIARVLKDLNLFGENNETALERFPFLLVLEKSDLRDMAGNDCSVTTTDGFGHFWT
jgi:hypothetical protein